MADEGEAGARAPAPEGPRFTESMPRPLLVVFLGLAATAVAVAVVLLIRPPSSETVSLADRRPPPRGTLSHDAGRIFPAPLPSVVAALEPPCPAVARARPLGGPGAVERFRLILAQVCAIAGPGVPEELRAAVRGLDGATIRTADFLRTGVESTVDIGARTIYLNVKFAARELPVAHVVPVLLHDAWHLAHPAEAVTAGQELAARTVELAACRELISVSEWPRWCTDARAIVALGRDGAIERLVAAGYAR